MNEITAKATFMLVLLSLPTRALQDQDGIYHTEFYHRMEQVWTELCPKVDICDRKKTEPTVSPNGLLDGSTTDVSCCKACSCHKRCHENLNCCFQPENATYTTKECMYVNTTVPDPNIDIGAQAYRIVSSAPENGCKSDPYCPALTERGLTGSCENDRKLMPWGDLFPVYSIEEDEIYKNELCACCHGVGNYVPMQAYLICSADSQSINSFAKHVSSLQNDFNKSHCYVTFRYPNPAVVESKRCYINTISTCPSTMTVSMPPSLNLTTAEVMEACESGPHSPFNKRGKYYKNLFCAICNGLTMTEPRKCHRSQTERLMGSQYSIILGLYSDHYQDKRPTDDSLQKLNYPQACRSKDEAPEMLDRCRDVFCPSGQVRDRLGHCVFTSTVLHDGGFMICLKLQYMSKDQGVFTPMLDENISASDILDSLQQSTPWPKRWTIFSIFQDVSGLHEEKYIFVFLGCTIQKLIVVYRDVVRSLGQTWHFNLDRIPYIAQQSILQYTSMYNSRSPAVPYPVLYYPLWSVVLENTEYNINLSTSHGYYVMKVMYSNRLPNRQISLPKLFLCDQVGLQSDEYLLLAENSILVSNFTLRVLFEDEFELVPNRKVKLTARVCREDSVFKTKTGNSSEFIKGKAGLILLVVTITSVLGL